MIFSQCSLIFIYSIQNKTSIHFRDFPSLAMFDDRGNHHEESLAKSHGINMV